MTSDLQLSSIHLDAVGGVAGDMFVACMLDALPHLATSVLDEAASVVPREFGVPKLTSVLASGIKSRRFTLDESSINAESSPASDDGHHHKHFHPEHGHHHRHEHSHHRHGHPHENGHHDHGPTHEHDRAQQEHRHTSYRALVELIESSALAAVTKHHATAILRRLAIAEADIHGVDIDDVHFHELADWDSLMDVVAAGSIIGAIGAVNWTVSSLPLGSGLVRTQHGLLPVPAPATSMILKGFQWRNDGIAGERVTPTGAAILAHIVSLPTSTRELPEGILTATGTGAGTRKLEGMPNILRAMLFQAAAVNDPSQVELIEFDVDDMTGEEIGAALDRLRVAVGVVDVSTGHRTGKKGRPVTEFRLLCDVGSVDAVATECFSQTSTIGIRTRRERRVVLKRQEVQKSGKRIKQTRRPDGGVSAKVESDELASASSLVERRRTAAHLEFDE